MAARDNGVPLATRQAFQSDIPTIQDLHNALCRFEYDNGFDPDIDLNRSYADSFVEYVRSRISESKGTAIVATVAGTVQGYLLGSIAEDLEKKRARLESMFVVAEHRRKGIGDLLVSEFVAWTRQEGVSSVIVTVAPRNVAAVELYRKNNFVDQTLVLELRQEWHL